MTIFKFTIKRCFRSFWSIGLLFLLPPALMFMPGDSWSSLPMSFHFYGIVLLFSASRLVKIVMDDRFSGILTRIGAAPVTHFHYLWQNLLAFALLLLVQIAAVIAAALLLHGDQLAAPLSIFVIFGFFSLTGIGLSLAWVSLYRHRETALLILVNLIILISMLGGLLWPIEAMPLLLGRIAMFLPTYWLTEALLVVANRSAPVELAVPLGIMLLFAAAFLLLGSKRKIT